MDLVKISTIKEWPMPAIVSHLRMFLGLASYYCRLIKYFATIASPLHKLARKFQPFHGKEEHKQVFTQLCQALISTRSL